ncbi:MAG TPA: biotin/lipoyl-containing protein [bacterium]|nr:biotin/lipoyl-containing protein [bacterium]
MTTYYVRVDGVSLEVALEETSEGPRVFGVGLRAAAVRATGTPTRPAGRRSPSRTRPSRIDLAELLPGWYSLLVDGRSHTLGVATWHNPTRGGPGAEPALGGSRRWMLLIDGVTNAVDVGRSPRVPGVTAAVTAGTGQVRAPMPGLVVAIRAEPGTAVVPGQPLIIMEAMKMQMEIRAPHAGTVREVRVVPGQDVAGNELLATVE